MTASIKYFVLFSTLAAAAFAAPEILKPTLLSEIADEFLDTDTSPLMKTSDKIRSSLVHLDAKAQDDIIASIEEKLKVSCVRAF